LHALGERPAAIDAFRKAVEIAPQFAPALNALATVLVEEGRLAEALDAVERAAAVAPADAGTQHNRGVILEKSGRNEAALEAYERALDADSGFAPSRLNRGAVLMTLGRFEAAVENNRRLVALQPHSADAWFNLAESLLGLGKSEEGLAACDRAISLDPRHAKARIDRGLALSDLGRFVEAQAEFDAAETISPGATKAYLNAIAPADPALERKFDPRLVFLYRGHERLTQCDWSMRDLYIQRLTELARDAADEDPRHIDLPLAYHALTVPVPQDVPFRIARIIGNRYATAVAEIDVHFAYRQSGDRIRIGYLSADFWEHLNAYLSYPLFQMHDRDGFEVFAYSIGPDDDSEIRKRIERSADRFVDLTTVSDLEAARRINDDGIDVLVDFGGYTQNCRPGIPALRPAPVQLAHIGFPGTMGAPWIDYRLTDRIATPPAQEQFWQESLVFLPHSFFLYDGEQEMPDEPVTRAEYGLPEDAFVFCCHNNGYKLAPEIFSVWMALLQELPDAVLWLVARDARIEPNLRAEARSRGVDAARIFFAGRDTRRRYFSRYRLADLFLDTPHFTAATTACDALWMGLPLLTVKGESFTSRMAASIVCALGMSDLVVDGLEDYRSIALRLATDRAALHEIRQRLAQARLEAPMFRTRDYVRHYERALEVMAARRREGKPPAQLHVLEDGTVRAD